MLKFIGTGGAYSLERGNNCAYLVLGSEVFFFDFGMDTFEKVIKKGILKDKTRVNLFLTHLHGDHVGGLATFISYVYDTVFMGDSSRINVYFPSERVCRFLSLQGISSKWYNFFVNKWDECVVDGIEGELEYTFHEVDHTKELDEDGHCNTYAIEFGIPRQFNLLYGGDGNQLCTGISNLEAFDYIYQETTERLVGAHMNYDRLVSLTEDNKTIRDRIYLMHLDDTFDEGKAIEDGFHVVAKEE